MICPASARGEVLTAYVKLNKWLQTEAAATLLHSWRRTFELRVGSVTIPSREPVLTTSGAVSRMRPRPGHVRMLYFDEILAKLRAAGMSEEQINQWVDRENHTITFQLVGGKRPPTRWA